MIDYLYDSNGDILIGLYDHERTKIVADATVEGLKNLKGLDTETIQAIITTAVHFHQILQIPVMKSYGSESV